MKEKPIIFSGPMVQAIIAGKKMQTRRIVKPQPIYEDFGAGYGGFSWPKHGHLQAKVQWDSRAGCPGFISKYCPYGKSGDRLWVRETWRYNDWTEDGQPYIAYKSGGPSQLCDIPEEWQDRVVDIWAELSRDYNTKGRACDEVWRPSIFMPRWASRITLEVTGVRVERVRDITGQDIVAEGFPGNLKVGSAYVWFKDLWDSINAKRGYPWESNPWTWVLGFRVVEPALVEFEGGQREVVSRSALRRGE